jgi:thymidylate synthase (FAD)
MNLTIKPKAYLIAETQAVIPGIVNALAKLGVTDWNSDAVDDAALLTEFAGKSCYMSFDTSLNKNLTRTGTRTNHEYVQQQIVGQGHGSVLEHSTVTFFLVNISRVATHEIVRHRAGAAYSQTSGRYVRSDKIDLYLPIDIAAIPEAVDIFEKAVLQMEQNARDLARITGIDGRSFSTKKKLTSAFRRIIGNGQANHIVVTMNHRAWRHVIAMRTDPSAEEEIRVIFADISRQLRARYVAIYADAVITEVEGIEVTAFTHPKV